MKRIRIAVIVVVTLVLSCAAGLVVARAENAPQMTQMAKIYLPLVAGGSSKIGLAAEGYVSGDFERLGAGWAYNLTPRQGALAWHELETRYPTATLISPAPSQLHPEWLWAMNDEYVALYGAQPRFDGIATHYYGQDAQAALNWLRARREEAVSHGYAVPIWLTEVGTCGPDEVEFMHDVFQFAIEMPWIDRVGWYKIRPTGYDPAACSALLDGDTLTQVGEEFERWTFVAQ